MGAEVQQAMASSRSGAQSGLGLSLRAALVVVGLAVGLAGSALAQQQPPPAAKKQTQPKAAPAAAGTAGGAEGKSAGDASLRARIEQLEEQLTDIQVAIGTLESIAKSAGTASSSATFRGPPQGAGAPGPTDTARAEQLEIQIRALLQQIEQLTERVRQLEQGRTGSGTPPARTATPAPSSGFGTTTVTPASPPAAPTPPAQPAKSAPSIGDLLPPDAAPPQKSPTAPAAPAGTDGGNPKQLYEQAYGFLLAQDYAAAETAFSDFLQKYPNDNLAGNAQYWLGETHFFRGQFKAAAAAYYKGYQTYARSAKAPDSLLKLALSLDKLGQKDAACQAFVELSTKFPNASPQIKSRAQSETVRIGCT